MVITLQLKLLSHHINCNFHDSSLANTYIYMYIVLKLECDSWVQDSKEYFVLMYFRVKKKPQTGV